MEEREREVGGARGEWRRPPPLKNKVTAFSLFPSSVRPPGVNKGTLCNSYLCSCSPPPTSPPPHSSSPSLPPSLLTVSPQEKPNGVAALPFFPSSFSLVFAVVFVLNPISHLPLPFIFSIQSLYSPPCYVTALLSYRMFTKGC